MYTVDTRVHSEQCMCIEHSMYNAVLNTRLHHSELFCIVAIMQPQCNLLNFKGAEIVDTN